MARGKYDVIKVEKSFRVNSLVSLLCAGLAQCCLIYSFIISDYSVLNVYQNSHHLKPLIYKISGSWGNHEGSMLLLLSITSFYAAAFAYFSKIDSGRKVIILATQSFIICCFAAFTAFASNPFERNFLFVLEGLGLNPILQDIGLALHPPMLYTGYIGFSLVFSFAIAGLLTERTDRNFAIFLKPWLFFAYGFLTAGIGLGAWWAYRELGWGGYWFWDPVENVSLMPWLAATALIHSLRVLETKESFKIWTIFLAIFTFILCLLGLFLVRSGILTSVHAFAIDAKRGFFVIALILAIGGSALLIFGMKAHKLKSQIMQLNLTSKIGSILFNNYFLVIAVIVVLLAVLYPIFLRSFFGEFITIGPNYYNQIFSILLLPFLLLFGASVDLPHEEKMYSKKLFNRKNIISLLFTILVSWLLIFASKFDSQEVSSLQIIILFLAVFALVNTITSKERYKNLTMFLAHIGFALIICGIVLSSSFSITKEVNLQKGQILSLGKYDLKFADETHLAGKNFVARQGEFQILGKDKEIGKLQPQLRYYPIGDKTTNEASIRHGLLGDIYLVLGTKDEQENHAVRGYFKPFIWMIWLGCFMIFYSVTHKIFFGIILKN